jgi:IS30 family transposase
MCARAPAGANVCTLRKFKRKVDRLTPEHGHKFSLQKVIPRTLNTKIYSAHAYAARGRGTNKEGCRASICRRALISPPCARRLFASSQIA